MRFFKVGKRECTVNTDEVQYDNILKVGCEKAITGPAARGDMATVEKHIEVLDERTRELYKELTNVIFDMKNGGIE